ncbi:beta-defensin 5-like [Mus pahari]|uniref:beta-defensin 5-like n=1 Tax=Mus pahari TaxID=10093 RepID=UPI000A30F102|nr:beta-defensin 5-like [Mus pahari]
MSIHYLLFAFLLVLLCPLAGTFNQHINNPVSCRMLGGKCLHRCRGKHLRNGSSSLRRLSCCKIK